MTSIYKPNGLIFICPEISILIFKHTLHSKFLTKLLCGRWNIPLKFMKQSTELGNLFSITFVEQAQVLTNCRGRPLGRSNIDPRDNWFIVRSQYGTHTSQQQRTTKHKQGGDVPTWKKQLNTGKWSFRFPVAWSIVSHVSARLIRNVVLARYFE